MVAIETRYRGATDKGQAKIIVREAAYARGDARRSCGVNWDYGFDSGENHRRALQVFLVRFGFLGGMDQWVNGETEKGYVWVWKGAR